jgi:hypothetical protein
MRDFERDEVGPGESPMGALPWALLGLGLLLAAGVVIVRSWPSHAPVRVVPPEQTESLVAGWEVEWTATAGEDEENSVVRLEPLHPRPERQAFDGAALSRVLEREGEPWLLTLPSELSSAACQVQLGAGGTLDIVPPGTHPVQRVLHATSQGNRRVLFGPAPTAPILVLDGVLHPMQFRERPTPAMEQPLLEGQ